MSQTDTITDTQNAPAVELTEHEKSLAVLQTILDVVLQGEEHFRVFEQRIQMMKFLEARLMILDQLEQKIAAQAVDSVEIAALMDPE